MRDQLSEAHELKKFSHMIGNSNRYNETQNIERELSTEKESTVSKDKYEGLFLKAQVHIFISILGFTFFYEFVLDHKISSRVTWQKCRRGIFFSYCNKGEIGTLI